MIATVSFQVDPENDLEVDILTRAMRDLAQARRSGMRPEARRVFEELERSAAEEPVPAANPAPARRPRRDEPIACPECGKVCASPQGLGAHRRQHTRPPTVDRPRPPLPEDGHAPDALAERDEEEPELDAAHACTSSAKRRGGWLAWCRCGFVTEPGDSREEALDLLAEHIEEA